MSFDEAERTNRWRFSREVSIGDLILALPVIWMAAGLTFTVHNNDHRLTTVEQRVDKQDEHLSEHDTEIAVLTVKVK
jgi:hypothetical protein